MNCKFCQSQMPDDADFCPYCGKNNQEADEARAQAIQEILDGLDEDEETVVTVPDTQPEPDAPSQVEEAAASPQIRKMKRIAILSGCLAVLALLGTVLFFGIRGSGDGAGDGWNVASWFSWMKPRQNTLLGNPSYTVSDSKAARKRQDVVATMEGAELTNGQLQVYYWMQVIEFINDYGYALSYVGMDYTQPLDAQTSMGDDGSTWQQYFLQSALEMWQSNQAFALMAKADGFQLDKTYREYLDGLQASMDKTAKENGFADADAMLQEEMGAGCRLEDYQAYMETYYTGYLYFGKLYDALDPTDAEISKYFDDNAADFTEKKITKDSGNYYTIRHIQINVEGGTKDDEGKVTYSDEEWEACRQKAQKLLEQWQAGEKTQESFAALVKDNTNDANTKENGGMYDGVAKGDLVKLYGEGFDGWYSDESRKAGDCQLVQSTKGYHLVYFVDSEAIWFAEARKGLMSKLGSDLVADALAKYPLTVNYKKIVLGQVELGK